MILVLSESDVAAALSMSDGVRLVEQALQQHAIGGGVVMPRISADLPGNAGAFRVMSAIVPDLGFFGLKTLTGYPGRRTPGETYFAVLLFSCDNGALRAMIAGNRLTGIRTGAATGVAATASRAAGCARARRDRGRRAGALSGRGPARGAPAHRSPDLRHRRRRKPMRSRVRSKRICRWPPARS